MKKTTFGAVAVAMAAALAPASFAQSSRPVALDVVKKDLMERFKAMNQSLTGASRALAPLSLGGGKAHEILDELCANIENALLCMTIGKDGIVLADEPNRTLAGRDASGFASFAAAMKSKGPQMSNTVPSFDGVSGFVLARPVMGRDGKPKGAVGVLVAGREMLEAVVKPRLQGLPVGVTIMQRDGFIVWDTDPVQIGMNAFTDPYYERFGDLKKLIKVIAEKQGGIGTYRFIRAGTDEVVSKEVFWETFGVYGNEWRVALIKDLEAEKAAAPPDPAWIGEAKKALTAMAMSAGLKKALLNGDDEAALAIFKRFTDRYPGAYSVQWVDPRGFNRFGYPPGNSLTDYDYNTSGLARDRLFLDALVKRTGAEFRMPLWEGKTGRFFTYPVSDRDINLGYIYFMIRE